jgi:hypothetical protein
LEVVSMCYEKWTQWRHERAREEDRSVWDLFERETATEPPRYVSDDELPVPERTVPEEATASAPR